MRILMLTYEIADEGGNFIRCFSLAKELVKTGNDVTIVASNRKKSLLMRTTKRDGVFLVEPPCIFPHSIRHNGTSPMQIAMRILYVLCHKHDVIHGFGHRPTVVVPALLSRIFQKCPYVADWSDLWGWGGLASYRGGILGNLVGMLDDVFEKFTYSHASSITVICRSLYNKTRRLGISEQSIVVVPPGASIDEIAELPKDEMRKKNHISPSAHVLVYLGNAPYDAKFLGQSYVEMIKSDKKLHMLFIGKRMTEFDEIMNKNNLSRYVTYYGFVQHSSLSRLLACADVTLLPYTNREINTNRYPNKIGDYMAAGRPIIANPTGDLKLLFQKYSIGVAAPENAAGFAKAVLFLMRDSKKREITGKNARHLAEGDFSWKRRAAMLYQHYRVLTLNNHLH